jgi:hypothetical protein
MTVVATREPGVAVARRAARDLCDALGLSVPRVARPGAAGLLPKPVLLRAADGWVHPGPPTAWDEFAAMIVSLGGHVADLPADVIDAEAGAWLLPAVAVRGVPAAAPSVAWPRGATDLTGAEVVVLGATWAAPLAGFVLAQLGAHVVRVTHPARRDPFPLRAALLAGTDERPLDVSEARGRNAFAALLARADVLVDATTPRVLANVGLGDPPVAVVRIAAFAHDDRPGYGIAAECRGGWAARYEPPRLGRVSVADPIAGLLAVLHVVDVVGGGYERARRRVALEDAVGHLFAVEARGA